jgi:adenosylcobinamide-GDP ribazoletransferase
MRRPAAQALAFLTPFGGAAVPTPAALPWFPIVGAALGASLGGIWWLAAELWTRPVAAAVVVVADLALTGMLHLDGLIDSADGLVAPMEREHRLEVMADPTAGAFGVGAALAVLLVRWAVLASLGVSIAMLACLWCASRCLMAVATTRMRYARPGGLASPFLSRSPRWLPVAGLLIGSVLAALGGIRVVGGVVALVLSSAAVLGLADRRVGGFTGDVLGAAGLVGETVGLLAVAARP